ncbi:hypothetical protein [Aureimonas phyllosphaerae]|uniref:DNA-binding transcriptional regulator YdaS (Cro superfamily) n=1 Tax=Aureimonas phyllosphaerae TaxID=1166078 RepID=A0A7W6BZN4_9HYPH|nr:hypothetical protein [Aureimonas phyllosphaerae]MBB3937705.1 DNA-binding transcriptional regulator YdaS (Cro superfamily) [Aureimonas phyllosphaerae]MBB3961760.1 DNA-binding transcriptional regulator YdaS (Cro superfamily) [Aureimonas phyllosphaerae]SFF45249.1 hypothetical protein SAMN05216566_11443 [Aureimonas phyllosphaerae]
MSAVRPTEEPRELTADERAMKLMTAALVDQCGGNGAAAAALGVSKALVSKWCHPRIPDGEKSPAFIPMAAVLKLERLCGAAVLTRWMTETAETDPTTALDPLSYEHVAEMALEHSQAAGALIRAKADGKIDAADRAELRKEFVDVIALFTRLVRKIDLS